MAALWTLGAVGIYIDSLEPSRKPIWAELQVIEDTDTTLHWFGSESRRYSIRGHFWDRANYETLDGYLTSSDSRTLTGPHSFSEEIKILDLRVRRIPDKRGEAASAAGEFFQVEMEVMKVG